MKKFLAIAAMLFATTAQADWTYLTDSADNNTRIMVDPMSFNSSINANHYRIVGMQFLIINNGVQQPVWIVTGADDCVKGFGEVVIGTSEKDLRKYVWAKDGPKLYDFESQYICGIYLALKSRGQVQ